MVEWNSFAGVRRMFTELGINVVVWDKPGCGASGRRVRHQSARGEQRRRGRHRCPRAARSGDRGQPALWGSWGSSRAGWIAPLAIQAEPSLRFWISISGVDDKENARYLLSRNPADRRAAPPRRRNTW